MFEIEGNKIGIQVEHGEHDEIFQEGDGKKEEQLVSGPPFLQADEGEAVDDCSHTVEQNFFQT